MGPVRDVGPGGQARRWDLCRLWHMLDLGSPCGLWDLCDLRDLWGTWERWACATCVNCGTRGT
eukprot:3790419-Pyramimonas_sp.AAC.1